MFGRFWEVEGVVMYTCLEGSARFNLSYLTSLEALVKAENENGLKTAGERPESMAYVLAEGITIAKLAERAGTLSECGSSAAPPSAPSIGRCWRVIIVKYYSHRFAHPAGPSDLGRLSLCVSAVGYHCFLVDGDCGVWALGSLLLALSSWLLAPGAWRPRIGIIY